MSRTLWTDLYRAAPQAVILTVLLALLTIATTLVGAFSVSWLVEAGQRRDVTGMYRALAVVGASFTVSFLISAARGWLKAHIHRKTIVSLIEHITHHERDTSTRPDDAATRPDDTTSKQVHSSLLDRTLSDDYYYQLASVFEAVFTRCRGIAGAIAVATISPAMAAAVTLAMIVHSRSSTNFLRESLASFTAAASPSKRRAEYLRKLSLAHDTLGEVQTLKMSTFLREQFRAANIQKRKETKGQHQTLLRPVCVSGVIALVVLASAWTYVGWQAWNGMVTLAGFALVLQGTTLMRDLGPLADTAVQSHKAYEFHAEIEAYTGTTTQSLGSEIRDQLHDGLELNDVSITYPGQATAALTIDHLRIEAGQHVAIVGANGAGKSTLMTLIADQHPCIVAFQHPTRYPAAASAQLTVGNSVDTAAATTQLNLTSVFDDLPDGEHTFLGTPATEGISLSGGQWQRLGVARALAHLEPGHVLLLDEPSSALNPTAEAELFAATLPTLAGQTVVVATHFLPNVRDMDRVIVLDRGHIVEDGTHQELMAAGGTYHGMFVTQAATFGADI